MNIATLQMQRLQRHAISSNVVFQCHAVQEGNTCWLCSNVKRSHQVMYTVTSSHVIWYGLPQLIHSLSAAYPQLQTWCHAGYHVFLCDPRCPATSWHVKLFKASHLRMWKLVMLGHVLCNFKCNVMACESHKSCKKKWAVFFGIGK
jgi:hypothetical protein